MLGVAGAAASAFGQASSFQGLGDLPGGNFSSWATAVSADGQVVVGHGTGTLSADGQAFRWTAAGGMVGLGTLPGGTVSDAYAVSADGSVVVGFSNGTAGLQQGYRWTAALGMVSIGNNCKPEDVSADGTVVVGTTGGNPTQRAFRWVLTNPGAGTGVMTSLGLLPGFTQGYGYSVSGDGATVVGMCAAGTQVACRWNGATITSLGQLPGGGYSRANTISASGQFIAGQSQIAPPPGFSSGYDSFIWTQQAGMVGLRGPAESYNEANGVSADGATVVGWSSCCGAYIWRSGRALIPLKQALEAEYGLQLTGWRLGIAYAVTPDGRTIVGSGTNPSGRSEAWIATLGTPVCYANCDGSATPPVLNILDMTCFVQSFAAGLPYANCDGSSTPPVLNIADFTCFLQRFAEGCP